MNNVNIVYSQSGLGTPATGQDFISGLIFYGAPANITVECLSVADAEAVGITAHTSTTAATYTDVIHYHIAEYFRGNPTGDLHVIATTGASSASSYSEITTMQLAANGVIRQVGVYEQVAFSGTNLALLQTQVTSLVANNMPLEVIYQPDFSTVSNLTALVDLSTLLYPNVSVCVGQDGAATGAGLYTTIGKSIGIVGITLGAVSSAAVEESIAWVANFNMANVELATPAFANGNLYSTLSPNLITQIDAKQYVFLRTFVGITGSYFNNDWTANVPTSTYSSIHINRTIHKAARNVRAALLPSLASPVYFNADGTIAVTSVVNFQSLSNGALANMQSAGEISQFKTIINIKQNVLATKTLVMTLEIVPVGVANTITINLGFVLNL